MSRAEPSFAQACRHAVGLEVSGVNHSGPSKGVWFANSVKSLLKTQSLLHLTNRLYSAVLAIFRRSILPLKSMFDNVKNAADDAPVIDTGGYRESGERKG